MIRVVAHKYMTKENMEKAKPLFEELTNETRKESGCIEYVLCADTKDKEHYVFVEKWTSSAELEAHMESAHIKRLLPTINELSIKSGDVEIMEEYI